MGVQSALSQFLTSTFAYADEFCFAYMQARMAIRCYIFIPGGVVVSLLRGCLSEESDGAFLLSLLFVQTHSVRTVHVCLGVRVTTSRIDPGVAALRPSVAIFISGILLFYWDPTVRHETIFNSDVGTLEGRVHIDPKKGTRLRAVERSGLDTCNSFDYITSGSLFCP